RTKAVAPPETASVAAIYVQDGDHVREGQVLVELDPTDPQADATRIARERAEQTVIAARQRALLDRRDTLVLPPDASEAGLTPQLLAVHQAQLRQKLADHRSTMEALRREQEQKEAAARSVEAEVARLAETVPLLQERAKARESL